MTQKPPSPTVSNGRDTRGRFAPGNHFGVGNPLAKRAQELRVAMAAAITEKDVKAVISAMINAAKDGDVSAARLVLERGPGPVVDVVTDERLAAIEAFIEESSHDN